MTQRRRPHAPRPTVCCLLVLAAALPGCASVEAWERGVLAQPHMALDPHPLRNALRAHVVGSREAAPPAALAEGGGCGCF